MQAQNNLGETGNLENSLIAIENYIQAVSETTKNLYFFWEQAFLDDEGIPAYEFLLNKFKLNVNAIYYFSKDLFGFSCNFNKVIASMICIINKSKEPHGSHNELKRGISNEVKALTSFSGALFKAIDHFMNTVTQEKWSSNGKVDYSVKEYLDNGFDSYAIVGGGTAAMWVFFFIKEKERDLIMAFVIAFVLFFFVAAKLDKPALKTHRTRKLLNMYEQMMVLRRNCCEFSSLIIRGCFTLILHDRNDYCDESYKVKVDGMISNLTKMQEVLDGIKTTAMKNHKEISEYSKSLKF
ncbi:uncharacterized protein EV154DRAFT_478935 [Mucor mucedo]|uniref:uncharacterized protein n=1 Tax=Mucor mucedo TaxID=29922 RepID=UPI00221EEAEC|nr:uncharacterized protein EV154DRAFT_478935 [Mucor mucedo]KAI7893882.1 hypothetical protein EV154DRAFT_478935 [Mucor mucedo]